MADADCPFDECRTIMLLGRLIKSNDKIENRKITVSYGWNLISKFMVQLENNVNFQSKKLEKEHFLIKFVWNFRFYTSGHSEVEAQVYSETC